MISSSMFSFQCDGKRRSFSSTVNILVTNNTREVLSAKQEWVKGGEAFNHPNDIMPGISGVLGVIVNATDIRSSMTRS